MASKARSLGDAHALHSDKTCCHPVRKPKLAQVERMPGEELRSQPTSSSSERTSRWSKMHNDTTCETVELHNTKQCLNYSSVQLLSWVWLFATPWTAACQAPLSFTNSQSLLILISFESVMPSSNLILYHPLLLLPSIFPIIMFFSNEAVLCIRRPKYWSFSFSISPSNEYSGLISFRIDCLISFQSKGLARVFSNTTVQKHQLFST